MLVNSSTRDTLLEFEPTFSSVLKLAVATVLTVASVATMIAILPQLHSDNATFSKPRGLLCILLPIIPFFCPFSRIILDSLAHLLFSKSFPNTGTL